MDWSNRVFLVIGAGVLAMPLAISHMGIVLGVFVVLWSGITAGFGLYLQSRCAQYLERGSASFFALSQLTYPNASVIFDAAIAIKCFGVGVSYLIIIGDLMPAVVQNFVGGEPDYEFLVDRHFWITAFMFVVSSLGIEELGADWDQVDYNSSFLPPTLGFSQVHQYRGFSVYWVLGDFGGLSFHQG